MMGINFTSQVEAIMLIESTILWFMPKLSVLSIRRMR